jgi:hypothetical protein
MIRFPPRRALQPARQRGLNGDRLGVPVEADIFERGDGFSKCEQAGASRSTGAEAKQGQQDRLSEAPAHSSIA